MHRCNMWRGIAYLCQRSSTCNSKTMLQGKVKVEDLEDFMGDWTSYAMIGISKSIQRCYQVMSSMR